MTSAFAAPTGATPERRIDTPLVSCVVITKDRRDELAGCLESLLRQTYRPLEYLVVDNASTDGTRALVAERFPLVRLIPAERNLGVPGGRNRGVAAAQGELVLCIDDDARLTDPAALARVVEKFAADERLACVSFLVRSAATGREELRSIPRADKRPPQEDYETAYFCGTCFAMRREDFLQAGGFWSPLEYSGEELDLSYRWLERGRRIVHSRHLEAVHRSVPDARPDGQYVYHNLRARCWVALRNLPWPQALSTSVLWWLHSGLTALRQGQWGAWLRGARDALAGAPRAVRERRAIGRDTVREIRRLSGRLWY